MKGKDLATCCGGLGACVCTVSMLLPVVIGTVGASASVMASMSGMSGNFGPRGYWIVISWINSIGPFLLVFSISLILFGMRNFGKAPFMLASVGGILLYTSMYLLNMWTPLLVLSSVILGVAYWMAYRPIVRSLVRRRVLWS
jgi:hypothetical protein